MKETYACVSNLSQHVKRDLLGIERDLRTCIESQCVSMHVYCLSQYVYACVCIVCLSVHVFRIACRSVDCSVVCVVCGVCGVLDVCVCVCVCVCVVWCVVCGRTGRPASEAHASETSDPN